ncbi:unnamed protein product [Phytophthora fragariaefolia]|uniref:Unnamed protein product n=1 Tax=Phytophthora fragariaefolia TaxID=1490495 RepID=A0A9W6YP08_9STRA|nr:unnamed protein product [Phytophthora fragariaefolia]
MRPIQATALVTLACLFVAGHTSAAAPEAVQNDNEALISALPGMERQLTTASALATEGEPTLTIVAAKSASAYGGTTTEALEDHRQNNDDTGDYKHSGGEAESHRQNDEAIGGYNGGGDHENRLVNPAPENSYGKSDGGLTPKSGRFDNKYQARPVKDNGHEHHRDGDRKYYPATDKRESGRFDNKYKPRRGNDNDREHHRDGDRKYNVASKIPDNRSPSFGGDDKYRPGRLSPGGPEDSRFGNDYKPRPGHADDRGHGYDKKRLEAKGYKHEQEAKKKTDPDCDEKKPHLRS